MKIVKQFTLQESWENDTIGNVNTECETILSDLIAEETLENIWVVVYEGNTALINYRADYMAVAGKAGNYTVLASVRNNRTNRGGGGTSRSFYASVGTVIKVYQLYD